MQLFSDSESNCSNPPCLAASLSIIDSPGRRSMAAGGRPTRPASPYLFRSFWNCAHGRAFATSAFVSHARRAVAMP